MRFCFFLQFGSHLSINICPTRLLLKSLVPRYVIIFYYRVVKTLWQRWLRSFFLVIIRIFCYHILIEIDLLNMLCVSRYIWISSYCLCPSYLSGDFLDDLLNYRDSSTNYFVSPFNILSDSYNLAPHPVFYLNCLYLLKGLFICLSLQYGHNSVESLIIL